MKTIRRFKSKGWYGTGDDERFDPMFDVEITREMEIGPIVHWDFGFIMKSCNKDIMLFERNTTKVSGSEGCNSTKYELEVLDKQTGKRIKYKLTEIE